MPVVQHTFGITGNMPMRNNPQGPPPSNPYNVTPSPSNATPLLPPYTYESPQQPAPAYHPSARNDSPDLVAARRELVDVDALARQRNDELNFRLNNPDIPSTGLPLELIHEEIHKLSIRKATLQQYIIDLQDPNSYAFQQSQAMTAAPDVERGMLVGVGNGLVGPAAPASRSGFSCAGGCACWGAFVFIFVIIVIVAVVSSRNRYRN